VVTNASRSVILENAVTIMVVGGCVTYLGNIVSIIACKAVMKIRNAQRFLAKLKCRFAAPAEEEKSTLNVVHLRKSFTRRLTAIIAVRIRKGSKAYIREQIRETFIIQLY